MQKLYTPGFQLYQFNSSQEVLDSVLNMIPFLNWRENVTNYKTDRLDCPKFIQWIESLLPLVKNDLYPGLASEIEFHVTNCWMNKSTSGQKHHRHSHSNAWWSGIYYMSTSPTSGGTNFYTLNSWYKFENENLMLLDVEIPKRENMITVWPEAGKLVLFPSSIQHETTINMEKIDRHTISFNVFPSGIFTPSMYTTTMNTQIIY